MSLFDGPGNKIVFIDESGDEGRTEGQSSDYYVVLALIIDEDRYRPLLQHFKGVRSRRFSNGAEMKSDTIGPNIVRRREILNDLTNREFELSILVIDKRKLTSPGFYYSPSFIKYLHARLYQNISDDFHSVRFRIDEIKSRKFMDEFQSYIEEKVPNTLFYQKRYEFVDSESDECVQAADFLSGTLRRCIENKETPEDRQILLSYFRVRSHIEVFPYSDCSYLYEISADERSTFDGRIEQRAAEEAYRFLQDNGGCSDEIIREMFHCLQILLSEYILHKGERWTPTHELEDKLASVLGNEIADQKLRGIIGGLRDRGVLIVSRRAGGYKLPTKESELYEYLNTQSTTIIPMVSRVGKAYEMVKRATGGEVDILQKDDFRMLRSFVEASRQPLP